MTHRERAEKFREVNGWPWCGECELDDSCHGCEAGLKDLAAAFTEVEAEALERVSLAEFPMEDESEGAWRCVICREFESDGHGSTCPWNALKRKP